MYEYSSIHLNDVCFGIFTFGKHVDMEKRSLVSYFWDNVSEQVCDSVLSELSAASMLRLIPRLTEKAYSRVREVHHDVRWIHLVSEHGLDKYSTVQVVSLQLISALPSSRGVPRRPSGIF
jgi:predicted Zn-dependent protease